MLKKHLLITLCLALLSTLSFADATHTVNEADIKAQLEEVRKDETVPDAKLLIQNLEGTLSFLEQARKQQDDINKLDEKIKTIPTKIREYQASWKRVNTELAKDQEKQYKDLGIAELEITQNNLSQNLQDVQISLNDINVNLMNDRAALERTQQIINENNQRSQQIVKLKYSSQVSKSLRAKLNAELNYLELNNKYNLLLGQNSDSLVLLDEAIRDEASIKQQLLQKQLVALQDVLNTKRLAVSEAQAQQAESLKDNSNVMNVYVQKELTTNADLSQFLLTQTQNINKLSQDNLRIKNILDGLVQTQRNIEEQISALQGTLALSRIINQQKQNLPTDNFIKGLSKNISDLRVDLFEYSQKRDAIYNIVAYISKLEADNTINFNKEEQILLEDILQERKRILADIIKSLNNQLNLSINIELNQKQVTSISDALQSKLQQQSFWVKSNNPINLTWLENFPRLALIEITEVIKLFDFKNLGDNLLSELILMLVLALIYGVINWKKPAIKERLTIIASQVNTLRNDNHWLTPEAFLWTVVLAIPSTIIFLAVASVIIYLVASNPMEGWIWAVTLSAYWLFFATILATLRPNGLAYRHFGLPQESNAIFQTAIKRSIVIIALVMTSSILSRIETIGFANDVIGQVTTIVALAFCLLIVDPLFNSAIKTYSSIEAEGGKKHSTKLLKLSRVILILAPIALITLTVLGYYYTTVDLIHHFLNSYFALIIWTIVRYFVYRSLNISSRRLAYRRLQEKRQKLREQRGLSADDKSKEDIQDISEENINLETVNQQLFRIADITGWIILFALFYAIWSDLISVAYYLDGVILWEQVETTSTGTVVESITLLNLMRAFIVLLIMYVLTRNIAGILEVTIFSRIKFSQGTPYTITTLLTYIIITIGCALAFSILGMSWSKLQWLFTALSVGLGFGLQAIFANFVSGIILLFERPIRIGDNVTIGEFTGKVSKIRIRATTLINPDNKEVIVPNQAFVTDRFINWALNNSVTRIVVSIGVAYGSDLDLVRKLLLQVADEAPKVMKDPEPKAFFLSFGASTLDHELRVYVPELGDRMETVNFLNYRINQLFNEHNINIAFNQLDVHLYNATTGEQAKIDDKLLSTTLTK